MAPDIQAFDLFPMPGLFPHQDRDIDAACIIAFDEEFLPVAAADHLEQIAIFERLQRRHVVGLLQAENVRVAVGDRQRRHLPRVIGVCDGAGFLETLIFGLALDVEEPQDPVLPELVAKAGEIEPTHQVLDIKGCDAN